MQGLISLGLGLLLVALLVTMAVVSNSAFAAASRLHFKIKQNVWNMLLKVPVLLEIMLFKRP